MQVGSAADANRLTITSLFETGAVVNPNNLLLLYRLMLRIRTSENRLIKLFADGEVPGFIHLSIGQEAVAAGVTSALGAGDSITTTHRGHGHVIARGLDLDRFFQEVMGKAGGICSGHGGSMHVADMALGVLGANGIVGGGLAIALGSALAHKVRATNGVAVAFFGDGAMAEGVLHETLNLAALWKLPLVLVCENNGWSEFSPTSRQFAGDLEKMAAVFGIEYLRVDGDRVSNVADAAAVAVAYARSHGTYVVECITHRVRGHFEGDPQKYRDAQEIEALNQYDPLVLAETELAQAGIHEATLRTIGGEIVAEVDAAIDRARAAPLPDFTAALQSVYAT
jgi:pyruvate dehydrogenase E1 component alpha subunit